ncbi:MAG TPA: cytidine deaminase [Bacillota bacterium]|nr:cytidine deaminase [Bacillota bacterium]
MDKIQQLITEAKKYVGEFKLTSEWRSAGSVAAALLSASGKIFTGICIDVSSGIGFCAEHSAIAEMLKFRETAIEMVVAVNEAGKILAPCGRCREFMLLIDKNNERTKVIITEDKTVELGELLPYRTD